MKNRHPKNSNSETLNRRGIELADRGWLDEAIREFDLAIEADRKSPFPRINRASVYMEKGLNLEALEDLLRAVKLAPDNAATHYHLGAFLSRFGSSMAVEQLQQCLDGEPENIDALIQLGTTLAERGEIKEAEDNFRAALEIDFEDPLANRELGVLLMERGCIHEAIDHLKTSASLQPDEIDTLIDLSMAYIQAGFYQQAEALLQKILVLQPDSLHANYNLAAIYSDWGNTDKSLEHLRRAVDGGSTVVRDWVRDDRMFDKLRTDGRFTHFMQELSPPDVG